MLERACDQNNSIMVECLLLLGADVNCAKEATSLIYQVIIQGLTFVFFLFWTLPLYSSHILLFFITEFTSLLHSCLWLVVVQIHRLPEVIGSFRYYCLILHFTCFSHLVDKQLFRYVSCCASLCTLFSSHISYNIRFAFVLIIFFLAVPEACGNSQARDQTHATAVTTPDP